MKLFEVQTDLTSFCYPIAKVIVGLTLIITCFFRRRILNFSTKWLDVVATLISLIVVLICILCIYISVGEILHTFSNRQNNRQTHGEKVSCYSFEDIVDLIRHQDIIEIEVSSSNEVVKIGSSAENDYSSPLFTNKKYYIGSRELETLESFSEELMRLSTQGNLCVISIDGISPDYYVINHRTS